MNDTVNEGETPRAPRASVMPLLMPVPVALVSALLQVLSSEAAEMMNAVEAADLEIKAGVSADGPATWTEPHLGILDLEEPGGDRLEQRVAEAA